MSKPTDCYVYVHIRASDRRVFYVGKGRGKRAWISDRRSPYWKRTVAKHGLIVQIVMAGLTEVCAFSLERIIIAKYGRANLVNLTDGGEGTAGHVVTEAAKEHLRKVNKGKFVSEETRRRISESNKGKVISEAHRRAVGRAAAARPFSEKHRQAVIAANRLRVVSDETRAKLRAARTDHTVYTLVHKEHGVMTAPRSYFQSTYSMDTGNFNKLIKGVNRSCKGWRLP